MRVSKRALLSGVMASLTAMALLAMMVVTAPTSAAAGAGAVSFTQTFHNATQSFSDVNPCTGAPGTVTLTYNGVFHVTELTSGQGAGTFWGTGTMTGDFSFVPDDASQPSYAGHFATWFGDNNNLQNGSETSTFSLRGTGSDGSTLQFHDVAHMSVSATGITISFGKASCG
jgi:hypothetical protein